MFYDLFVQSLAIMFLLVAAISFHAKTRSTMLITQIISILLLSLHFFLLHAWSGFAMQFILVFAVTLFLFKDRNKILSSKIILVSFIILFFIFTLITWQGYFSIFAFLGISSAIIAKWQKRTRLIRLISIPTGVFWIIYDVFVNSYGGIISESILLTSIFISLITKRRIII